MLAMHFFIVTCAMVDVL